MSSKSAHRAQPNGSLSTTTTNLKRKANWVELPDENAEASSTHINGVQPNGSHASTSKKSGQRSARLSLSELSSQRSQLPIASGKDQIIREISLNTVTILLGETGSGKTTQVPQYLLDSGLAGDGVIAVTQPRRVAAISLAERVAAEQGSPLGQRVGYSIRFEDVTAPVTRIKFITDGMLVRELLSDRLLSKYSVIILDEAHERTLRTDLLMANLRSILQTRNSPGGFNGKSAETTPSPLRVVIMSATLDAEKFSGFFHGAKILYVKGRQYPVKINFTVEPQSDYVDSALRTFYQIHADYPPGDVLIFLPGQEDIDSLERSINECAKRLPTEKMSVMTCPMYAGLPPAQQRRAFQAAPSNTRKCILATNIAETSITIPGIRFVIDTGKCKEKRYLASITGNSFETLLVRDISKSSAMQRAGRAGREAKGFCFRLYTEAGFDSMEVSSAPEILRCDLAASMLELKCLGQDLESLDFIDKPESGSVASALKLLWTLGALDRTRVLTPLGKEMARLPLEPILARTVMASRDHKCTHEILPIISILSCTTKLFFDVTEHRETAADARKLFRHPAGDHLTLLAAFRAYEDVSRTETTSARREWCRAHWLNERTLQEASKIRHQLVEVLNRMKIDCKASAGEDEGPVLKCLLSGLIQNSAFLQPDGSYKQIIGHATVKVHPGSTLADKKCPAIVYNEIVHTTQIFARTVSSIPKSYFASLNTLTPGRAP